MKPVELTLDQCIKCNICVSACPVAAVTERFPGPKYEAPQAARFRGSRQPIVDNSVDYCSGCRVCNLVCPTGVKIAEINARARASMVANGRVPLRQRIRNNLLARPELLGRLGQPVALFANAALKFGTGRTLLEKVLGIDRNAPLPPFANTRFSSWFRERQTNHDRRKVVYFHGCSTEYYEPRVGKATVFVLEQNGIDVEVPRQNCCGLPLLSNGEFRSARQYHRSNIASLLDYARAGVKIVGSSTSCTLTLKEEAPELLDLYDDEAKLIATQTYDVNEFLLELFYDGRLSLPKRSIPLELAYHAPCQYRGHRMGKPSLELLGLIPGLRIIESEAACCGIAGTYGYKKEKYRVAMEVGRPLFEFIQDVDGPVAVCDSETCRWQITHATGLDAIHPIELLAVAYGGEPEGALAEALAGLVSEG
jgi:glycerol-3-phosphate dehydrogenase subunit C